MSIQTDIVLYCCTHARKATYDHRHVDAEVFLYAGDEIKRLRDIVRDCRKRMRELDVGGHLEQSWPDFCEDTNRLIEGVDMNKREQIDAMKSAVEEMEANEREDYEFRESDALAEIDQQDTGPLEQPKEPPERVRYEQKVARELGRLGECRQDFAMATERRLRQKTRDGIAGWDDPEWAIPEIKERLAASLLRGNPVDVANFAMFWWNKAGRPDK